MALLGLWLKPYNKIQLTPVNEGETLARLDMSFTYPQIPRRAKGFTQITDPQP